MTVTCSISEREDGVSSLPNHGVIRRNLIFRGAKGGPYMEARTRVYDFLGCSAALPFGAFLKLPPSFSIPFLHVFSPTSTVFA